MMSDPKKPFLFVGVQVITPKTHKEAIADIFKNIGLVALFIVASGNLLAQSGEFSFNSSHPKHEVSYDTSKEDVIQNVLESKYGNASVTTLNEVGATPYITVYTKRPEVLLAVRDFMDKNEPIPATLMSQLLVESNADGVSATIIDLDILPQVNAPKGTIAYQMQSVLQKSAVVNIEFNDNFSVLARDSSHYTVVKLPPAWTSTDGSAILKPGSRDIFTQPQSVNSAADKPGL
jgi:hypothetical protein